MIKGVPLADWIALAVGVIGLVSAYLQSKTRLPAWARRWLAEIGEDEIEKAIETANTFEAASPEQRRTQVVGMVQQLARQRLGLVVPTSIANLLVEFVYQKVRRK